jgi:hypothetical protein
MSYAELIAKALKGRSVNSTAKEWGIPQKNLDRIVKGQLPDFTIAKKMAEEAGIGLAEAFEMLTAEEANRKNHSDKLSKSFNALLRIADIFKTRNLNLA